MPAELAEKLRQHHKHCGKIGCPVPKPPEAKESGPTGSGDGEFRVGDIVRLRKWEGRVDGLTWYKGMEKVLDQDQVIMKMSEDHPSAQIGEPYPFVWPLSQLDLVRRPSSETPASSPE